MKTILLFLSALLWAPHTHQDVLFIQGIFSADGKELLRLSPVRLTQLPDKQVSSRPANAEGVFSLCIFYEGGELDITFFDALVADDSGKTYHGFFELIVPVRSLKIERLEIRNSATQDLIKLVPGSGIQH